MALWGQTTEKEQFHETELARPSLNSDCLFNKLDCSERLERKATFMEFSKEGDSNRSNGSLSNNLTEFKEALKSGIKRMEAFLQEAESTVSNEAQQYEELRQRAEVKIGLLEGQLQEMENILRSKESAIKQLGENLTSKIQELEHRLAEKEKISSLLEKHNSEITILKSETEAKVGLLEAQLQEKEEDLWSKESAIKQLEESFTAKSQEMEDQPNEKESLLEIRQADLNDLKSKLDSFSNAPESVNTLREEDVDTLNLPAYKEEKGMVPSKVQEKMTSRVEDWREQLMIVCGR